jgi:hypothetical protein
MYRLTVDNQETYMVVTRNVFSGFLKIHKKYDLKGKAEAVCTFYTSAGDFLIRPRSDFNNFATNSFRKETGHLWLYNIYMTVIIRNAANLAQLLL